MASQSSYSALDRLLHRVAFAAPRVQLAAAEIESRLCAAEYRDVELRQPIFVTSLPRAGTTLLLEVLSSFPTLAAHSYRDMPFVMAPMLWARFSGAFRTQAELRERAHGDGMLVGYDSPEAFEEVLWMALWPEKYADDRIELWGMEDARAEAHALFAEHLRKIVALRRPGRAADGRYVSKNNANIARLALIGRMFPDATILVPFREPLAHAASLLRQHENFLEKHRGDPFVRRYMADIGHFEFGELHRPIALPGLATLTAGRDPRTLNYWLAYWIAAFDHLLTQQRALRLISYEAACAAPLETLSACCAALGLTDEEALARAAARFRPSSPQRYAAGDADNCLIARATALHERLLEAALPSRHAVCAM